MTETVGEALNMTLETAVRATRNELTVAAKHFNAATDYGRKINEEVNAMRDHLHTVDVMLVNLARHCRGVEKELAECRR